WNKRTPFQIMLQARKVRAPGTTEGKVIIESGKLASAIAAAPIRYADPHHASARTSRCCSQSMIKKTPRKPGMHTAANDNVGISRLADCRLTVSSISTPACDRRVCRTAAGKILLRQ